MKESLRDYLDNLNYTNVSEFIEGTNSVFNVVKNVKKITVDLEWIDQVENAIPYLDNIIRNPKRFIIEEQDIVPVEKSKKITQETIRHLSQHTSYIQGLDEDGMVMPVKVLNVKKEETVDLYENRFIYSLIKNLYMFIKRQIDIKEYDSSITTVKTFEYTAKSKINGENINTKINIDTNKKEVIKSMNRKSTKERLIYINEVITGFMNSSFIRSISTATPVRSPIRKTNIILKDQNFRKALELWEFLEKYNYEDPIKEENIKTDESKNVSKYNLDFASYINYNNMNEKIVYESNSVEKVKNYIAALVDELVLKNKLSDNEFKKILTDEITKAKTKRKKLHNEIKKVFNSFIIKEENKLNKTLNLLRK